MRDTTLPPFPFHTLVSSKPPARPLLDGLFSSVSHLTVAVAAVLCFLLWRPQVANGLFTMVISAFVTSFGVKVMR